MARNDTRKVACRENQLPPSEITNREVSRLTPTTSAIQTTTRLAALSRWPGWPIWQSHDGSLGGGGKCRSESMLISSVTPAVDSS